MPNETRLEAIAEHQGSWGISEREQFGLQRITNDPRYARLVLRDVKYFGPLDIRRHPHIPNPVLEEGI